MVRVRFGVVRAEAAEPQCEADVSGIASGGPAAEWTDRAGNPLHCFRSGNPPAARDGRPAEGAREAGGGFILNSFLHLKKYIYIKTIV